MLLRREGWQGERQTDLSAVDGRRADGVDPTPHEGRGPSPCAATDVGPGTRQSLTRAASFFDDLLSLTLFEKLVRGQVPERAMGPTLIVVAPPDFDDGLCFGQ